MAFFAIYPALGSGGGGGGGITSINGDTTAAQVIAAGTGISVSSVGGTTTITNTGGGGSGTVTSVSVITANGVSGTVATATTTPAITLALGAITPTSINASGNITGNNLIGTTSVSGGTISSTGTIHAGGNIDGANLSGTNTGDQTITLTGDVTGSGTGSFAATISANAVTNAKLAQMPAHTFKGNNTGVTANALDLTQTQLTAELNQFTTTLQGVVPGSGGGTTNFLRADGTWATPPDTTGITQLTGDVTAGPGSGSQAASLVATSNATLTTLSGLTTASSLASVGTITSGTWNGTTIAINHGGTGQTTQTAAFDALSPTTTTGDMIYRNATNNVRLPIGTNGQVLATVSTVPTWITPSFGNPTINIRAPEGGGTVTLTNADNKYQRFNLTSAETVVLPSTGVLAGDIWEMINPNPFTLTIEANDASTILTSWGDQVQLVALTNAPATNTDWSVVNKTVLFGRTWIPFTAVISNLGTIVTQTFAWMRSGPNMLMKGNFDPVTPGGGQAMIDLPILGAGVNIDTNPGIINNKSGIGSWTQLFSASNPIFSVTISGICDVSGGSTTSFRMTSTVAGNTYEQSAASANFTAGTSVDVGSAGPLSIPIAEWAEV